jgi:hypothetical protein
MKPEDRLTDYAKQLGLNGTVRRRLTFPRHLAYFWVDSDGREGSCLGNSIKAAYRALDDMVAKSVKV